MKIFRSALMLIGVAALFCPSRLQAGSVYLPDPGGLNPPGLEAVITDDPASPIKLYYDWRVEMLQRQPLVRDIPSKTLGTPFGGVQATLSVTKSRVRPGEKIAVKLVRKNISDAVVRLPLKRSFESECGLTTLVDGPSGNRVPYRWLSDLGAGHCLTTTLVPDWDRKAQRLYPGQTTEVSFDLSQEFAIDSPGRHEVVVQFPMPPDLSPRGRFNLMNETFVVSNKIAVVVY